MQRKRPFSEVESSTALVKNTNVRFFSQDILYARSVDRLKRLVKYHLNSDENNFVNAANLCEEIFRRTRPLIQDDPAAPQRKKLLEPEFSRLINAYSANDIQRLDYVEYARLGNDIVLALILSKKYSSICELLDYENMFAVLQVKTFIRAKTLDYQADGDDKTSDDLAELSDLFKEKCKTLFAMGNPPDCTYVYYFLYVMCQLGLEKTDELQLPIDLDNPQAKIYLDAISANKNIQENETKAYRAMGNEELLPRTYEEIIAQSKNDAENFCMPTFAAMSQTNNPLGCAEIVNCLSLKPEAQELWCQLGILQGCINKLSPCISKLIAPILTAICESDRERFIFEEDVKDYLLKELKKSSPKPRALAIINQSPVLKAMMAVMFDSEVATNHLRKQIIASSRSRLRKNA